MSFRGKLPLFLDDSEGIPPVFPTLRYLSMTDFPDYPANLFERLAIQAPNLTHLYLMPLRSCTTLQRDLQHALPKPEREGRQRQPGYSLLEHNPASSAKLPPSIERVVIQPADEANSFSWSSYGRSHFANSLFKNMPTARQLTPEQARQRWVDAGDAKTLVWMPSSHFGYHHMPAAEILKSTTRTVTYEHFDA